MSESKINVSTGFSGGVSVSLRADTAEELLSLQNELRVAAASNPVLAGVVAPLTGPVQGVSVVEAVATVAQVFPGAAPVSTVGQPLPQPGAAAPQAAQPGAVPPGVAYPGDCVHGTRPYVDKPARGKPWRRFECALPYKFNDAAHNASRCKPANVEG